MSQSKLNGPDRSFSRTMEENSSTALIYSKRRKSWMLFQDPLYTVVAETDSEVVPALKKVESLTQKHGYYSAGFVSYEAARGMDENLSVRDVEDFPMLWFGVFSDCRHLPRDHFVSEYFHPEPEWSPSINHGQYCDAIQRIKELIAAGDTYQVNYTYRMLSDIDLSPLDLFLRMAAAQESEYSAYIDTGKWCICSASPELFFSLDGDRITSHPMKGTAPRGMTQHDDLMMRDSLLASEKERAENIMITDMVRNDMGRIAQTGSVRVTGLCSAEKYPTVWQMTSQVEALTTAPIDSIFTALFPASSITGAPKHRTMEIIADIENGPRGIYTGAIGYIEPDRQSQFNVAIRTVLFDKEQGRAEYGVGGGIVWDSEDESEFAETLTKSEVLTRIQPRFSILETILWEPECGYHLLDGHLRRATQSAEYFSFRFDREQCLEELDRVAMEMKSVRHKVRVLVDKEGRISIEAIALSPPRQEALSVALARSPVNSRNPFLYHKTTNRAVYQERLLSGFDDVILWNERGELTESAIANIILDFDGQWFTPPVESGLLAGTMRAELLSQGRCRERILKLDDLDRCDHIYFANSIREIYKVDLCPVAR